MTPQKPETRHNPVGCGMEWDTRQFIADGSRSPSADDRKSRYTTVQAQGALARAALEMFSAAFHLNGDITDESEYLIFYVLWESASEAGISHDDATRITRRVRRYFDGGEFDAEGCSYRIREKAEQLRLEAVGEPADAKRSNLDSELRRRWESLE